MELSYLCDFSHWWFNCQVARGTLWLQMSYAFLCHFSIFLLYYILSENARELLIVWTCKEDFVMASAFWFYYYPWHFRTVLGDSFVPTHGRGRVIWKIFRTSLYASYRTTCLSLGGSFLYVTRSCDNDWKKLLIPVCTSPSWLSRQRY